ncbi:MAG TPA: glycosyltransferase family 2 protein [Ignavibacteria bacterium]
MSTVGIVTVVTNEKHNLESLYSSLSEQTYKDFSLYFVDNNSKDGSVESFKELNKAGTIKTEYIKLNYNAGFSGGSNIGAECAIKDGCKYLFISNNDLVYDKNAIAELLKAVEDKNDIASAGPLLMMHSLHNPDRIQEFGGKVNFKRGTLKKNFENRFLRDVNLPDVMETDFVGGGVCFIKSAVFKKVGMFETAYFGYFDEIDLAYRLKIQNHYKMVVTSKAIIWHNHYTKRQATSNKERYYFEYYLSERNKFLYYHKYGMYFYIILMLIEDCLRFPWRLAWFIKVCDFKLGMYYLKGMLHGLLNRKGKPSF